MVSTGVRERAQSGSERKQRGRATHSSSRSSSRSSDSSVSQTRSKHHKKRERSHHKRRGSRDSSVSSHKKKEKRKLKGKKRSSIERKQKKHHRSEELLDELARMIQPEEAPRYQSSDAVPNAILLGPGRTVHQSLNNSVMSCGTSDIAWNSVAIPTGPAVPSPLIPSLGVSTSASPSQTNGNPSALTVYAPKEVVAQSFMPQSIAERHFPRLNPTVIREARRIYVGNLPQGCTDADVKDFFERRLRMLTDPPATLQNGSPLPPGNVSLVQEVVMRMKDNDRPYAFMELIDDNLATIALDRLNELPFVAHASGKSSELRLGRPKEYREHVLYEIPGLVFVSGLPLAATRDNIQDMFTAFGTIRHVWVMMDAMTGISKGRALIFFEDSSVVASVCQALNDQVIEEGGLKLVVRVANDADRMDVVRNREVSLEHGLMALIDCAPTAMHGQRQVAQSWSVTHGEGAIMLGGGNSGIPSHTSSMELGRIDPSSLTPKDLLRMILTSTDRLEDIITMYFRGQTAQGKPILGPTRVLVLLNLVDPSELEDDEDYQNLLLDIEVEMERHGCVEEILIPRFPPEPPDREQVAEQVRLAQQNAQAAKNAETSAITHQYPLLTSDGMADAYKAPANVVDYTDPYLYMPGADTAARMQMSLQQQQREHDDLLLESFGEVQNGLAPDYELLLADAWDRARNQWEADNMHPVKNGIGRVFVVYRTVEEAMRAQQRVGGRRFNGRTVITSYIAEDYIRAAKEANSPYMGTSDGYSFPQIGYETQGASYPALTNGPNESNLSYT